MGRAVGVRIAVRGGLGRELDVRAAGAYGLRTRALIGTGVDGGAVSALQQLLRGGGVRFGGGDGEGIQRTRVGGTRG